MDYLLEGVKALVMAEGGWKNLVMFAVGITLHKALSRYKDERPCYLRYCR